MHWVDLDLPDVGGRRRRTRSLVRVGDPVLVGGAGGEVGRVRLHAVTPDDLATSLQGGPALRDIRLLVLHGSRARGEAGPGADWDFGYLADPGADLGALAVAITVRLRTDRVDVVDLATASALLRYRTARDGVLLLEREPDTFLRFRLEATLFWCDVESVVRAAYDDVLGALG